MLAAVGIRQQRTIVEETERLPTVTSLDVSRDSDQLLKDSPLYQHHHDVHNLISNFKVDTKNIIKYIIFRDRFLFVFFTHTDVYFVLEFDNNGGIRLNCIEKTGKKVIDKSCVIIDGEVNKMILINGGEGRSLFMSKFNDTKKSIFSPTQRKKRHKSYGGFD